VSESRTIFINRLEDGLNRLDLSLTGDAVERLWIYFSELRKWSRKVNLIAKGATDAEVIENHFLDSLTLLPLLEGEGLHLLDVGTGAGFPGLVLKAARPGMRLTLVEPRLKRISFLKHVARTLKLAEVEALACRVEDEQLLPADGDFTHVTSRAVTEIGPFLEMVSRFAHPGVQVICMKGPKWQQELERAKDVVQAKGYVQSKTLSCLLPFSGAERNLVVFLTHSRL